MNDQKQSKFSSLPVSVLSDALRTSILISARAAAFRTDWSRAVGGQEYPRTRRCHSPAGNAPGQLPASGMWR